MSAETELDQHPAFRDDGADWVWVHENPISATQLLDELRAERDRLREVNRRLRESLEKSKASLRFYDTHTSLLDLDDIDAALAFAKENP